MNVAIFPGDDKNATFVLRHHGLLSDEEKKGSAIRNRPEGEATTIDKKILDRDQLKSKKYGVVYVKRTLRPFFVKGSDSVKVYLY